MTETTAPIDRQTQSVSGDDEITIGYLVPEFPGQTHNFFWREVAALALRGVKVHFVSTKRPPAGLRSTSWARAAEVNTDYLFPFALRDIPSMTRMMLSIKPRGIRNAFQVVRAANGLTLMGRLRLIALILVSIKLAIFAQTRGWKHIHVHSCADSANLAMFMHILFGINYSLTLHNPIGVYGGNQRAKFKHASFAIFITEAIRQEAREILTDSFPERSAIAPMGVELDQFKRSTPYQAYNGSGELRLFCCARLNPVKGLNLLIEAVSIAREKGSSVTLEIAGEDDAGGVGYRVELEQLILSHNADSFIKLVGAVPEEAVRASLDRCHLFALPSLNEPLGVAAMEAMAMELPVIATRAGGIPTLIDDGVSGILVEPGSPSALAEAIIQLENNPALAMKVSANARNKIENQFSSDVSAKVIAEYVAKQSGRATATHTGG